jgi:hypothetical protein
LCLGTCAAAPAATIRFTGVPSNNDNGTLNGFSSAAIDGIPVQNLVCDDYGHTTYIPSGPFDFVVSNLDNLSLARFAEPSGLPAGVALINYQAAAILLDGMTRNPALTADYQYAIWDLFTPTAPAYHTSGTLVANALAAAGGPAALYASVYARLVIYTPDFMAASNQEFIGLGAVPEPAPIYLAGLAGVYCEGPEQKYK